MRRRAVGAPALAVDADREKQRKGRWQKEEADGDPSQEAPDNQKDRCGEGISGRGTATATAVAMSGTATSHHRTCEPSEVRASVTTASVARHASPNATRERASAPWSQLALLRSVTSKLTFSPPDRMSARRCLRTIACAEVFVVVHAAPPAR